MALQSTVLLDIVDQTQTITFTQSGSTIDQITFSSNQITLQGMPSFNLSKSDLLLYISYLNTFVNALITNFPSVQNSRGISLPLCEFDITFVSEGALHIDYTQTSIGSAIFTINYVPLAQAASFALRNTITMTMQEFFLCSQLLNIYAQQVGFN